MQPNLQGRRPETNDPKDLEHPQIQVEVTGGSKLYLERPQTLRYCSPREWPSRKPGTDADTLGHVMQVSFEWSDDSEEGTTYREQDHGWQFRVPWLVFQRGPKRTHGGRAGKFRSISTAD